MCSFQRFNSITFLFESPASPTGVGGASNFPALPSTVATPSPPRPVSQAQRSASPQAPRPLSGARAPLAPPSKVPLRTLGTAGAGATGGQGQSSYEKLMAKLHSVYPRQSRFVEYMYNVFQCICIPYSFNCLSNNMNK